MTPEASLAKLSLGPHAFTNLPTELTENIANKVELLNDLLSLRVTCIRLQAQTRRVFIRRAFTIHHANLATKSSLQRLINLAHYAEFATAIQHLRIVFDPTRAWLLGLLTPKERETMDEYKVGDDPFVPYIPPPGVARPPSWPRIRALKAEHEAEIERYHRNGPLLRTLLPKLPELRTLEICTSQRYLELGRLGTTDDDLASAQIDILFEVINKYHSDQPDEFVFGGMKAGFGFSKSKIESLLLFQPFEHTQTTLLDFSPLAVNPRSLLGTVVDDDGNAVVYPNMYSIHNWPPISNGVVWDTIRRLALQIDSSTMSSGYGGVALNTFCTSLPELQDLSLVVRRNSRPLDDTDFWISFCLGVRFAKLQSLSIANLQGGIAGGLPELLDDHDGITTLVLRSPADETKEVQSPWFGEYDGTWNETFKQLRDNLSLQTLVLDKLTYQMPSQKEEVFTHLCVEGACSLKACLDPRQIEEDLCTHQCISITGEDRIRSHLSVLIDMIERNCQVRAFET